MPCYYPMQGYRGRMLTKNGKRKLVFSPENALGTSSVFQQTVACGQCIGCRLEYSRQWAIRCVHEASLYQDNCFISLTYNNENLPNPPSLVKKDFQDFMKRLRDRVGYNRIRYYYAGEYGERYGRPHYHALIFNYDFLDKVFLKKSNGVPLYRSPLLEEVWPYGHSSVGSVTFESAAYVARYVMKKVSGDAADKHYSFCPVTGEVFKRLPEYTDMSRRPGIASGWFKKYHKDVYPSDSVVIDGRESRPPKFYDSQFELISPEDLEIIKSSRRREALKNKFDSTTSRLRVREQVQLAKLKLLVRNID